VDDHKVHGFNESENIGLLIFSP